MPQHGDIMSFAAAHVFLDEVPRGSCDWGDCDNDATCLRFDGVGHGWLPCCDDCAKGSD